MAGSNEDRRDTALEPPSGLAGRSSLAFLAGMEKRNRSEAVL